MNILVTGAAGFIASHMIEELLKDASNTIVGIDNFYSGTQDNIDFISKLDTENRFSFFELDVRDFDRLYKIVLGNKIEYIYHFAAIASVEESIKNPLISNEVNLRGTLNVLEVARLTKAKRVVFSSSASVYGDEPTQPKNEQSLLKPISPYGYEKLMGEQYMRLYNNLYGVETVCLRYFNVYGQRQNSSSDYSGVISIFEKRFKEQKSLYIYGDGEQYRDFIYVKDIVKTNIKAMNMPNISGEVFCVGTSKKTSINKLVEIFSRKFSTNPKVIYETERKGDIKESICDNTKLKKVLKLDDFVGFDEGINKL